MINVKERNSPNLFVYVFVSLFGIFIVWNEYRRNKSSIETIILLGVFLLVLFAFFFRTIEIELGKSTITVKFKLLGVAYRLILVEFDKVKIDGVLTYDITFTKDGKDVLTFILDTDLEPKEQNLLLLEMRYKSKSYQIGNRKNAKELFERIKDACKKEVENIQ